MSRLLFLFAFAIVWLTSCNPEEMEKSCSREYFYYGGSDKIRLTLWLSDVWIEFENPPANRQEAKLVVLRYPFLDTAFAFLADARRPAVRVRLNQAADCAGFKTYLARLNQDAAIRSATPLFSTSKTDAEPDLTLLSEVLVKFNPAVISEADFIQWAKEIDLELVGKTLPHVLHFRVVDVRTGFEALEISNQVYETGMVEWAHPNFIPRLSQFTTSSSKTSTARSWQARLF